MTVEILTSPERRRRWSTEEKARVVAEAKAPGAMVAAIARRHGVSRSLVYTWRRERSALDLPDLVPVVVEA
jgi:transposase